MAKKRHWPNFGEWDRREEEKLFSYEGDSYLVDSLIDSGYNIEKAQAEVQDPEFLKGWLEYDGIKEILADSLACKALRNAIIERNASVIDKLIAEVQYLKVPKKRGPKGKMKDGKYTQDRVAELHQQGLSWGKVAMREFGDSSLAPRAKAHYKNWTKKQARDSAKKR